MMWVEQRLGAWVISAKPHSLPVEGSGRSMELSAIRVRGGGRCHSSSSPVVRRNRFLLFFFCFCWTALLWEPAIVSCENKAMTVVVKRGFQHLAGFLAQITDNSKTLTAQVLVNRDHPEHAFFVLANVKDLNTLFTNLELSLFWGSDMRKSTRMGVLQYDEHLTDPNLGRTYVFRIHQTTASLSISQERKEVYLNTYAYKWDERLYHEERKTVVVVERKYNGIPAFSAQIYEQDRKTPFSGRFDLTSENVKITTGPPNQRNIPSHKFIVAHKASDLQSHPNLQLCLEWEKKENLKPIFMDAIHKYEDQDLQAKMFVYRVFENHISLSIVNLTNEVGKKSMRDYHNEDFRQLEHIPSPDAQGNLYIFKIGALHVQVEVWSKLSDKGIRTLIHSQKAIDLHNLPVT